MYVESYFGVLEALHRKVKPALRVALAIGALAVAGRPEGKLVVADSGGFAEVPRVEVAVEDYLAAEVVEFEGVLVGDVRQFVRDHAARFYS